MEKPPPQRGTPLPGVQKSPFCPPPSTAPRRPRKRPPERATGRAHTRPALRRPRCEKALRARPRAACPGTRNGPTSGAAVRGQRERSGRPGAKKIFRRKTEKKCKSPSRGFAIRAPPPPPSGRGAGEVVTNCHNLSRGLTPPSYIITRPRRGVKPRAKVFSIFFVARRASRCVHRPPLCFNGITGRPQSKAYRTTKTKESFGYRESVGSRPTIPCRSDQRYPWHV